MARDGTGGYTREVSDYTPSTDILSADINAEMDDLGNEIANSIAKDGQTTPSANLPMGTYRHTGVGNASARNHYAAAGQVQDSAFLWGGTAGGTADARTISVTPAITAYAAGQVFRFINGAAVNTTAVTLAINGLSATAVNKGAGATALAAGDFPADAVIEVVFDGTVFRLMAVQLSGIGVSLVRAASVTALGALPISGGTLTGALSVTGGVNVFGPAASERVMQWGTAASVRWRLLTEETAESGANAGSNFVLEAYDDAAAMIGEVFAITRATRVLDFKVAPTINGAAINTSAADITSVVAGTGLNGGATSGAATLNLNTGLDEVGTHCIAQNGSGGAVTLGNTLAGSSLSPSKSGTWRNMGATTTGGTAGAGDYALWQRTV